MVRIQVAIQGGGAKIIGLVAAMEVLQKMEAAGEVEVTRLAGTSAGAIVAALYSAGVNMGQLRLSLGTGELRTLFQNYQAPGIIEIAERLIAGSPVCDPAPIREFLRGLLAGVNKTYVRDLKPNVRIVSANVASSTKYDHKDDDTLLEALMSSSALPFVFRVWDNQRQPEPPRTRWGRLIQRIPGPWQRKGNPAQAQIATDSMAPLLVDGGICENLPINELLGDEYKFGSVVAITFSTGKYSRPTNILGFGKAVLDTAIDNSVHRARSLLPPSAIFEIGRWFPISTLDFAEAIAAAGNVNGPGAAYNTVSEKAEEFFNRYVQRQQDGNPATSYDPWRSDSTTVRKVLEANWRVCAKFCLTKFRYDHVSMVVTLFGEKQADRLSLKVRFSVLADPLVVMRFSVMNTINRDYLGRTSWTVRTMAGSSNTAETKKATAVPIKNPDNPEERWVALYFDEALPANSGPYEFTVTDFADTILADLKQGRDVLRFTPQRATGMTEYAEFAVVYRMDEWDLTSEIHPDYEHLPADELSANDKERLRGTLEHDRYNVTGYKITNIPEAKSGITIKRI